MSLSSTLPFLGLYLVMAEGGRSLTLAQLTFMSSYSIVLAPIAALMAVDFFLVKRQKLDIYELYRPDGIYRFTKGWNWRSYIALFCAIAPNLPGMINSINTAVNIGNIKYLYMISNISGDFSMSSNPPLWDWKRADRVGL